MVINRMTFPYLRTTPISTLKGHYKLGRHNMGVEHNVIYSLNLLSIVRFHVKVA
jgi:hypothetical protein